VTFLASKLPWIEIGLLVLHIVGFFAIVGTLWGSVEPSNARTVLLDFYNGGNCKLYHCISVAAYLC
jgi:hypothetical protein